MKKVIIAHPGRQHSFRTASALKKEGILFKYITTVYDSDKSYLMRLSKKMINKDNLKRANNRKCEALLDSDVLQFNELLGFIELLLWRVDHKKNFYRWWNRKNSDLFGRKVARYAIKHNVDAVIMYDSTATKCFSILRKKAPHIKRIMDTSIANRIYLKEIYENEYKKNRNETYILENNYMWDEKIMKRLSNEIRYTDYFIVPSNFVKDSFKYSDVNDEKIYIVPYGANIRIDLKNNLPKLTGKIRFLFVGQVIARKGIEYLLESFSLIPSEFVELEIVGDYNEKSPIYLKYKNYKNITFRGQVTSDKMKKIYQDADVFVFPSLAEGMALVGLEAMSCGLPIISTYNSGLDHLIINEYNGFIIPPGDTEKIKEKIEWFIINKDKIHEMGRNSQKIVSDYTWENYERNLRDVVEKLV